MCAKQQFRHNPSYSCMAHEMYHLVMHMLVQLHARKPTQNATLAWTGRTAFPKLKPP